MATEKKVSRDLQSVARQLVAFDETKKKAEKRRQEWEERKRRQLEEERRLRQKAKESEKGIYMKAVIASGFINEYPGEYALLAGMIIDGMRIIKQGKEGEEYRQAYIGLFEKRIAEISQAAEEDKKEKQAGSKKEEKQDQTVAEGTKAGDSSPDSSDTADEDESKSEDTDTAESDVEEDDDSSESSSNGTSWDGNNYGNIGF